MRKLLVSIPEQTLALYEGEQLRRTYPVSTSRNGCGQQQDSFQTPRGKHYIRAKIGSGLPAGSVLKGRRPTGEVKTPEQLAPDETRDWITTRILWLCGLELGLNRLGKVDTMQRYIYIHGTPHAKQLGKPGSIGCVRMADADVIELFDAVEAGDPVEIVAD